MKRICVYLIGFYRKHLSKLKRKPTCKFYPTCSEYALRAFEIHGFFKAAYLTIRRIMRCNPLSSGGVDYVPGSPERARWESENENNQNSVEKELTE